MVEYSRLMVGDKMPHPPSWSFRPGPLLGRFGGRFSLARGTRGRATLVSGAFVLVRLCSLFFARGKAGAGNAVLGPPPATRTRAPATNSATSRSWRWSTTATPRPPGDSTPTGESSGRVQLSGSGCEPRSWAGSTSIRAPSSGSPSRDTPPEAGMACQPNDDALPRRSHRPVISIRGCNQTLHAREASVIEGGCSCGITSAATHRSTRSTRPGPATEAWAAPHECVAFQRSPGQSVLRCRDEGR